MGGRLRMGEYRSVLGRVGWGEEWAVAEEGVGGGLVHIIQ